MGKEIFLIKRVESVGNLKKKDISIRKKGLIFLVEDKPAIFF